MIVKNSASDFQQVRDQRVTQGIPDGQSFFLGGDNAMSPQHSQLLGHYRLIQSQSFLQLVNRPPATRQYFENTNPCGMRQSAEECGFEGL